MSHSHTIVLLRAPTPRRTAHALIQRTRTRLEVGGHSQSEHSRAASVWAHTRTRGSREIPRFREHIEGRGKSPRRERIHGRAHAHALQCRPTAAPGQRAAAAGSTCPNTVQPVPPRDACATDRRSMPRVAGRTECSQHGVVVAVVRSESTTAAHRLHIVPRPPR